MANCSETRKKWSKRISLFSPDSLGFRLFSAFIVIIVIVLSAYTVFSVVQEQRKAKKNLASKGQVLADLLSAVSRAAVFAENKNQLTDIAAGFASEPDVVFVGIYNATGKELYTLNKRPTNGKEHYRVGGKHTAFADGREARQYTDDTIAFAVPVVLKMAARDERSLYFGEKEQGTTDRVIGFVRIVMGLESLNREILAIVARNAVIVLIFISASVVLVSVRVRRITKPLETLTRKVKALGEGSDVTHVPVDSSDEVGRLATAFNTMLDERKNAREAFQKILMEIHDGIGGITTNISLLSELAKKATTPERVSQSLETISSLSKEGMVEIRSLMYSLDGRDMSWSTLSAELRNRGTRTLDPHGIAFEMVAEIEERQQCQPVSLLCLHLFRVYREALTNIIKHSGARNVRTSLVVRQGLLTLSVHDDGKGCGESTFFGNGRGIANIKSRAAELGGKAVITGDNGTRVVVEIPLAKRKET